MSAASAGNVPLYSAPGSANTSSRFVPTVIARTLPGPSVPRVLTGSREPYAAVSWMLAIAVSFLSAGLAGVSRPVLDFGSADTAKLETPPEVPVEEITMAELAAAPAEPETAAGPPDAPPASVDDLPPEPLLTAEDIYEVPPAPPLESAMRIYEPAPARPAPTTQPRRAEPSAPRPAATPAPAAAPGPATAARGGKGKFPTPPYPAFAKAKGLTGTVTLSIRVSAAGDVTSASVAGSCGSSELDAHAASWVTRRWKWPAGTARTFRLPVTFRLR